MSLEPNRGSTSVPADSPVEVVFDRPVTRASVAKRFSVSPPIPGCNFATVFSAPSTAPCWIHWLDPVPGFELIHDGAVFQPATPYTFTLSGGFADAQGDRNNLDHHWVLTTAAAPLLAGSTPADRATGVPLDAPLAVSFTAAMDAPSTAAAISLSPAVAGTRVVRETSDHTRFVILPGQLLDPRIEYTISVAATARGEDEQAIAAPVTVHFLTGSRLAGSHAVVLAGFPGEGATEVLLPDLAPAAAGEPFDVPLLLTAPRCQLAAGCGAVPFRGPMETYSSAAVSPDGAHLAVAVAETGSGDERLEVLDTATDTIVLDEPGAAEPSWSPDGTKLAFVTANDIDMFDVRSGSVSVVAAGTTAARPPLWSGTGALVVTVGAPSLGAAGVDVIDETLAARYALPGAPSQAVAVAVSPSGDRVALATADGGVLVLPAAGGPGSGQRLSGRLDVVGFAGEGILVAVDETGDAPQLVRVSIAGGDSTPISLPAGIPDPQSVRVAPDGRRLVCLAVDLLGARQVYVANADGSGEVPITRFLVGGVQAQAVGFAD